MDYLVYEEENAETLQFFLWFCGYVVRWSELSTSEKQQSPPWSPEDPWGAADKDDRSGRPITLQTHRRERSKRLNQILEILDGKNVEDNVEQISDRRSYKFTSNPWNFSKPRRNQSVAQARSGGDPSRSKETSPEDGEAGRREYFRDWRFLVRPTNARPGARQPFRNEISQIIRNYISADAPRRLQISDEELAECLEATRTTTHPSALLPAFIASETVLKSQSHPGFIRESQRNANRPRLIFVRVLASLLILLGFILSLLLILSPASRFWRVASLFLWWPGFTVLIAAAQGLCLFLYVRNLRQFRPWESSTAEGRRSVQKMNHNTDDDDDDDDWSVGEVRTTITSDNGRRKTPSRASSRKVSIVSSYTLTDPTRKASLQVLGEVNSQEREARVEAYAAKSLGEKIWDDAVKTQNRAVRLLEDRTVLLAVCCGGAAAAALTIGSLWIPSVGML